MIKLIKNTFYHETWTKIRLMWFLLWAKQLSFGSKCEEFEREFSKWQGRKDSIFVNSGSSANLALIQSLMNLGYLSKGDKVGFSALGWSTTVMPIIQLGLKPVPIDVMSGSLNINKVPKDINCLFMTNLLGICPANLDNIVKYCKDNHIILLEDNCESLGSEYKGKKLGNFGLASTFSFYVGHHMSTIEGGMICTNNKHLARELRIVRAHGWDRNLDFRTQDTIRKQYGVSTSFYSRYTFYSLGYNLRPTEIAGFLGLLQLPYLKKIVDIRGAIYDYLAFHINKDIIVPNWMDIHSAFALPIICKTKGERDLLVKKCSGIIETRPIVGGDLTSQPFYILKTHGVKTARKIHETGLYIGINPDMTQSDLETIIRTIND